MVDLFREQIFFNRLEFACDYINEPSPTPSVGRIIIRLFLVEFVIGTTPSHPSIVKAFRSALLVVTSGGRIVVVLAIARGPAVRTIAVGVNAAREAVALALAPRGIVFLGGRRSGAAVALRTVRVKTAADALGN